MSPPAAESSAVEGAGFPHVVLFPSAGMGHLTPFLRLAAALADLGCEITLVTPQPAVSAAESLHVADFLAAFSPRVRPLELLLLPMDTTSARSTDPFCLQFEAIRRSAHLLGPHLAGASPAVSALVTDISLVSEVVPVAASVDIPNYVLSISSTAMLAFCASFPRFVSGGDALEIPGVVTVPTAWFPQPLLDPSSLFSTQFLENGRALAGVDGIIVNSWEALEPGSLAALNSLTAAEKFPPVFAVGPLLPTNRHLGPGLPWLDSQPERSVVFVAFGNRTSMSTEQMKELAAGLELSGCRFLWVVKSTKVDKEDDSATLEELLGGDFLKKVEGRGLVVKNWVDQDAVLAHPAVGGFVSHCGWNSVTEAALRGVRVLAWPQPQYGDQRINAWVTEKSGLGFRARDWSWEEAGEVVSAQQIGQMVSELMESPAAAAQAKEDAARAVGDGGSSAAGLKDLIAKWVGAPAGLPPATASSDAQAYPVCVN